MVPGEALYVLGDGERGARPRERGAPRLQVLEGQPRRGEPADGAALRAPHPPTALTD